MILPFLLLLRNAICSFDSFYCLVLQLVFPVSSLNGLQRTQFLSEHKPLPQREAVDLPLQKFQKAYQEEVQPATQAPKSTRCLTKGEKARL